jgi:hypothetical protein
MCSTNDVIHVRTLDAREGQTRDLYTVDGHYVVVSTVEDLADRFNENPVNGMIGGLANSLGGYAVSGEETMAFPADETGEVVDWGEVAVANGDGSKEAVLEQLRNDELLGPIGE